MLMDSLLLMQRREFIIGDVEPTDAESAWHSENEEEDKLAVSFCCGMFNPSYFCGIGR